MEKHTSITRAQISTAALHHILRGRIPVRRVLHPEKQLKINPHPHVKAGLPGPPSEPHTIWVPPLDHCFRREHSCFSPSRGRGPHPAGSNVTLLTWSPWCPRLLPQHHIPEESQVATFNTADAERGKDPGWKPGQGGFQRDNRGGRCWGWGGCLGKKCVCTCVHMPVCAYACVHACVCVYACVCMHMPVCVCMPLCVPMPVYACLCVHMPVCACLCTCVCMPMCVCVHTHAGERLGRYREEGRPQEMHHQRHATGHRIKKQVHLCR